MLLTSSSESVTPLYRSSSHKSVGVIRQSASRFGCNKGGLADGAAGPASLFCVLRIRLPMLTLYVLCVVWIAVVQTMPTKEASGE